MDWWSNRYNWGYCWVSDLIYIDLDSQTTEFLPNPDLKMNSDPMDLRSPQEIQTSII